MNAASIIALCGSLTALLGTVAGLAKVFQHVRTDHSPAQLAQVAASAVNAAESITAPPAAPPAGASPSGNLAPPSA